MSEIKLSTLKRNPTNPRIIKDHKFKKLVQSIKDFPAMMELRPIIVDENNMIMAGNQRRAALEYLQYVTVPRSWVKKASELTEEQKKRFMIQDNTHYGDWDLEMLTAEEWGKDLLADWGLQMPDSDKTVVSFSAKKKDLSERIEHKYSLEIVCESEREQEKIFEELKKQGYVCRILTIPN